ncbi:MAG: DUF4150 domain-containing protein [Paracoccus sp. (in: a-proteobacteria)]|uniref:DUF4150 domain-containing protein n=1 Tax=Paracoccus sp. TaxID=267 RepID=UPI0026DFA8AE|nr:DUF4150 domain-containing protein [Paracoccus sp. (in: a-proteobacteria)]MDO5622977.1 DUF4150 domain-containing protein [Paracoccus sp. (in: a-proteobacteria)]
MSVTIKINGLTITHRGSGGQHRNSAPDICKTPSGGYPVPYAITARNSDIDEGTQTVFADGGHMIATKPSIFTRCFGDEAGSMGGVISGTFLKRSHWITYSPNVYAEGQNICRLSDKLFMNDRNTISGQGGQREIGLGGDPVMNALCDIFCQTRDEWHRCRAAPPPGGCPRPSVIAKEKTQAALDRPGSPLHRAMGNKIGAAERALYTAGDRALDAGRKFYTQSGLKNALNRAVRRAVSEAGINRAKAMGRRFWLKMVPGLNILSTALDVYMTAQDIYDIVKMADNLLDDALRIQPDFAVLNSDGSVQDIYDFKFDREGYQDTFSESQKRLYQDVTGKPPIEISDASCNCAARSVS